MDTKEQRLKKLRILCAGDAQCDECLSVSISPIEVCKKCIEGTPAFTAAVNSLMRLSGRDEK